MTLKLPLNFFTNFYFKCFELHNCGLLQWFYNRVSTEPNRSVSISHGFRCWPVKMEK